MGRKDEILKIWRECFPEDTPQWRDMLFDAVYSEDVALTVADSSGLTVSSLLLLPYVMRFHGAETKMSYIYGAGTSPRHRMKGHMGRLIRMALHEAAARGDVFVGLVPASDRLRQYYSRFGFSTVGYRREQRYTAGHSFVTDGAYDDVSSVCATDLYADFSRMESESMRCGVRHSLQQFLTVMADVAMSDGSLFAAVSSVGSGRVSAMAWAKRCGARRDVVVTELLSDSYDAANAVLSALQRQAPGSPLTVLAATEDDVAGGGFIPGAMVRITDPAAAFGIIAKADPGLRLTVRLTDETLPDQSGVYVVSGGSVRHSDAGCGPEEPDLYVTPDVLAAMMFSSNPVAAVTGLPGGRPHFSLMLD